MVMIVHRVRTTHNVVMITHNDSSNTKHNNGNTPGLCGISWLCFWKDIENVIKCKFKR